MFAALWARTSTMTEFCGHFNWLTTSQATWAISTSAISGLSLGCGERCRGDEWGWLTVVVIGGVRKGLSFLWMNNKTVGWLGAIVLDSGRFPIPCGEAGFANELVSEEESSHWKEGYLDRPWQCGQSSRNESTQSGDYHIQHVDANP
ncbi:hypothetical protein Sjap_005192 [Stephania japonica]|uniref:Uncharacterized protein n=1 Tax=Stephania japonica TaxID=461633 RepID=A0AAP0K509_9MAGN